MKAIPLANLHLFFDDRNGRDIGPISAWKLESRDEVLPLQNLTALPHRQSGLIGVMPALTLRAPRRVVTKAGEPGRLRFRKVRSGRQILLPALAGLGLGCNALFGTPASSVGKDLQGYAVANAPYVLPGKIQASAAILPLETLELPAEALPASSGKAADLARAINAGVPFTPLSAIPARPFLWADGVMDRERATDCLAAAAYYEAGTRPADQRAVMQVVLNRVRHSAFPRTVCGVVFQGSDRSTGCQFTFTCDGAMLRRQPSSETWTRARLTALEMLTGRVEPVVGNATHYHTDWVHPVWSSRMLKIAAVDTHLFFRWRGRAGEPQAFASRYSGVEPSITKMALLSFSHRDNALPASPASNDSHIAHLTRPDFETSDSNRVPAGLSGIVPQPVRVGSSLTARAEPLPDQTRTPDADVFLVALDGSMGPDSFLQHAQQHCAGKSSCRFFGWTNAARKATKFPVSGASIDALSFSFIRAGSGDAGKARWNCNEFPRDDRAQCLRRGG